MNVDKLENKAIYLAPFNYETECFFKFLNDKIPFTFCGYLDNYKTGLDISDFSNITKEFDYIIILSPKYLNDIVHNLEYTQVPFEKILYAFAKTYDKSSYFICRYIFLYKLIKYIVNLYSKSIQFFKIDFLKLLRYRSIYKNQNRRAFIIGNGPSLRIEDLNKLKNEITFAANKIYLAFDGTDFRPTYYFVIDNLVYIQNYDKIKELKLVKFFSRDMLEFNDKIKDGIYCNIHTSNTYPDLPYFGTNPIKGFYKGYNVPYIMTQFAIYMGIKEIYFIGIDFNFVIPTKDGISPFVVSEGEVNHFHKSYREVGEKWNRPNMDALEKSFIRIKQYCSEHKIKVYNASRNTKLDVFDKVDFDKLFV